MAKKPLHPGFFVADYLDEYGLRPADLAGAIGVSRSVVSDLIHGRRALSTEMAVRLGAFFGGGARLWLAIQQDYELDKLGTRKQQIEKAVRPVAELVPA
ncbi:MAG: HigA family addiction module antitoxin [Alphaproteobacteria bacterium]|jgi:addiction module HigA family antidote|nr:HigA family addiction module antidote protein [Thalassospira sp.]MCE2965157.1 HigA family addiction module antitoxin [Alphaproteobacteria bacterium]